VTSAEIQRGSAASGGHPDTTSPGANSPAHAAAADSPGHGTLDHTGGHAVAHVTDPTAEPSVEWGWHGEMPRASRIAGWVVAAILLLMLIGNQIGHVEDIWLILGAAILVLVLIRDQLRRRTPWRR
jgi:hypothetical protein